MMMDSTGESRLECWAQWILTFCAVCAACCLVWFRLDHIGLDATEVLHVVASQTPLPYLLRWTSTVEVHPPTFYLLLKGLYAFFDSEFGVKSFLALGMFGLMGYAYAVGLLHSRRAALAALCLVAVNPLFLQAARSLRPHILVFCFLAGSAYHCLRYIDRGRPGDLWSMAFFNVLGFSLHYMFAVYMLTQSLLIVLLANGKPLVRRVVVAGATALGGFLPISYFAYSTLKNASNMVLSKLGFVAVALSTAHAYDEVVRSLFGGILWSSPLLVVAGAAVFAVTAWQTVALARRGDRLTLFLIGLFLTPGVFLVVTRHGFAMYKYIPQVTLSLALLVALALARFCRAWTQVVCLAALVLGAVCAVTGGNAYVEYREVSPYKALGPVFTQAIGPDTFASFAEAGSLEAYNYFYAPLVAHNRILDRTIEANQASIKHMLVGDAFFQQSLDDFITVNGRPDRTLRTSPPCRFWTVARRPVARIESLPVLFHQTMAPSDFLAHVHSLRDMMFMCNFGDGVSPTRTGRPGTCDFVYENACPVSPRFIGLKIDFDNLGEQDRLLVRTRFDDEPETLAFGSAGPSPWERFFFAIDRQKPFRRMCVAVEIVIEPITPRYPNWNHGLTRLKGLDVVFASSDEPGNLYPDSINRLQQGAVHTGDMSRLVPLAVQDRQIWGLEEQVQGGQTLLAPRGEQAGEMTFTLEDAPASLVIFPRVSGVGYVAVHEVTGEATRQLFRINGVEGQWSPMLAGYAFLVPFSREKRRTFRVEVQGPGAQFWSSDQGLVFGMRPR